MPLSQMPRLSNVQVYFRSFTVIERLRNTLANVKVSLVVRDKSSNFIAQESYTEVIIQLAFC